MQFNAPPILYNEHGKPRTVGFELEFSNLGIEESVRIIQDLYGGEVHVKNRFAQDVKGTRLGDFSVEFDLTLLTEKRYKKMFVPFNIHPEEVMLGAATLEEELEKVIERIAGKLFPYEIATPPVEFSQLEELEKLRVALYRHHAQGTEDFITNAFGTHINIELPSLDTKVILSYLQAFLLMYPWLLKAGQTNLARKISPFIDPFPDEYVELAISPAYMPDTEMLIMDYHRFNPDRNRPLDMYPLFAFLHQELFAKFKDVGKVKPRRTFHYRLPNSSISDPEWSLAQEWNLWVMVEKLACTPDKIALMSEDYLNLKRSTLLGFEQKWIGLTQKWIT